jgi:acyl carrier protein
VINKSPDVATILTVGVLRVTRPELIASNLAESSLEKDLGIDSLSLLEIIEFCETHLDVTVPDEVTGQLMTVRDILTALERLVNARQPPQKSPSDILRA